MKYIVYMENSFCLLGKEFFSKGNGAAIGSHNPYTATQFESREVAEVFAKTFDLPTKIGYQEKFCRQFDKCDYKYREVPLIDIGHNRNFNKETDDADAVLAWRMKTRMLPEKATSSAAYQSWPDLYSVFKHLHGIESYSSKDYKKTYYSCSINTTKDASFDLFKTELSKVLDFCTYIDDDGYKVFSIFDHELSQYESRYFLYKNDGDWEVSNGRRNVIEGTFEKCFDTMKREFWYE